MHKLELLHNGKSILKADTEKECNEVIRRSPKYKDLRDLSNQTEFKVKVVAPYVTKVEFSQIEGSVCDSPRKVKGKQLSDIGFAYSRAGNNVKEGYNKCDIYIELSNKDKGRITICASHGDDIFTLKKQLAILMPFAWLGSRTKDGFVY